MAWREPAGALEYSDDEELPYTQKENWAGKVMLSPPRHRADPYDLERSPLDDLHDLNVRDYGEYTSPSWLNQRTEVQLDQFTRLLAEMEAETRALHKEWSEQQAEDAGASGRASAAEGQAEKEASPPTTGLDASLEQRVRSLDLEVRNLQLMNALTELRITREAGEDAHAYAAHVERLEAQLAAEQRRGERLAAELDHANLALSSMESVMEDATLYIQLLRRRVADLEARADLGVGVCVRCGGAAAAAGAGPGAGGRWGGDGVGRGGFGFGGAYGAAFAGAWGGFGGEDHTGAHGHDAGGRGGGEVGAGASSSDPFSMPAIRKQIHTAVADTEGMPEAQRKQRIAALRLRWHPDKNPVLAELATEVTKVINEEVAASEARLAEAAEKKQPGAGGAG